MAEDIELRVSRQIYRGWKRASVTRSIETLSGTFRLSVTDRWEDDGAARTIRPGAECSVSVAGEKVIRGFVDLAAPRYSGSTRETSIEGRDRAGDLVDCSAVHDPDEWNNLRLNRLVEILAKPFGIGVTIDVDPGEPFPKFKLQPGETAFAAIERLCRTRGVLPVSDGKGGLLLTRAGRRKAPVALESLGPQGNVLAAEGEFADRERHSQYIVRGFTQGSDLAWADEARAEGRATDRAIRRHRPLLIVAEGQVDKKTAQERAQWEATIRAGRARRATYTVQGWTARGQLWQPNTVVAVRDSWLAINEDMLIASVRYRRSEAGGTLTTLTVVHPDAFKLIPLPETDEEPGW